MDQAKNGAKALEQGDFNAAITYYTAALKQRPGAVDYYIKRSTAYTRLGTSPQEALKDAEIAVVLAMKRAKREFMASAQLRRAIALFHLERYVDAKACLEWVKKSNEKEKSLAIWEMKIAGKLKALPGEDDRLKPTIKELPDVELPNTDTEKAEKKVEPQTTDASAAASASAATPAPSTVGVQTPPSKIRHEWYQQNDTVIVSLFAKGIPKDDATVNIQPSSLSMSFPLPTGSDYDFSLDPLFANIDPGSSSYKIMSTKAEFTLKKLRPGQMWPSLEGPQQVGAPSNADDTTNDGVKRAPGADKPSNIGPAYPTSSKSGPKDWDKLATEMTKKKPKKEGEEEDDEYDGEEGDPTQNFFNTLFKGADDDTKRAMMKSYQESNGTALSTNWAEVSKGPVETLPPDGMVAKKWGE